MKYYVCGKASGYFLGEYLEWDLRCGPYKTLKIAENIKKIMSSRNNEIYKELHIQEVKTDYKRIKPLLYQAPEREKKSDSVGEAVHLKRQKLVASSFYEVDNAAMPTETKKKRLG